MAAESSTGSGVFIQLGTSAYIPKNAEWSAFLDRETYRQKLDQADLVVTHGGTGAIVGAVKKGKKVVAIPRLHQYGEHVDDHQVEIVKCFSEMGLIEPCFDVNNLASCCARAIERKYRVYESNTCRYVDELSEYIRGNIGWENE